MKRGLMDRLTNRDVLREQKINIDYMVKELKEKNELVGVQADALDEFKEQVLKLTEEISGLWGSVNDMARKGAKKDESENN